MKEFAFETALFDEPSRADFVAIFAVADRDAFVGGFFGGFFGEINVVEEGAGASFLEGIGEFVGT